MIKLLLVEDDVNLCYIVQAGLQDVIGGYEVITAGNGLEGVCTLGRNTNRTSSYPISTCPKWTGSRW